MMQPAGAPRWTEARHPGNCRSCASPFAPGERVLYWPRNHAVSCSLCGEVEARRLTAGAHASADGPVVLDLSGLRNDGSAPLCAPDLERPFWRAADGTRHSYRTLRCRIETAAVGELGEAHLTAIHTIAAAALAAGQRGDGRETRRLAVAAGRLCAEIAGFWIPTAVEIPKR
jgi:hypothetical protein